MNQHDTRDELVLTNQEFVAIKKDYPIWGLQSYLTRFFGLLRAQLGSLN